MEKEDRVFRVKHRQSAIVSVVFNSLFALFTLVSTIVSLRATFRGETVDWGNSWWVTALLFVAFVFFAVKELQVVYIQLSLSKEGIWYHQLGSQRFIPWEQVEGVDFFRAVLTREKLYYLILKSELNEDQKIIFSMKQDIREIPLWRFVNRWLGSELRNEIKRLDPSLPMEEGLRNS